MFEPYVKGLKHFMFQVFTQERRVPAMPHYQLLVESEGCSASVPFEAENDALAAMAARNHVYHASQRHNDDFDRVAVHRLMIGQYNPATQQIETRLGHCVVDSDKARDRRGRNPRDEAIPVVAEACVGWPEPGVEEAEFGPVS